MNIAFYTGVSGMIANQKELDNTAHNMANLNTTGFKPSKSGFSELLYTQMDVNVETTAKSGHGVKAGENKINFKQGMMRITDNNLDFAIAGDGFFCIETEAGTVYTRNGEFGLSVLDSATQLVDKHGNYVLTANGQRITLTSDPETGTVDYAALKDSIGVFSFENTQGLQVTKNGYFTESPLSGLVTASDSTILSGALEASGTELGTQMAAIIESQRAYQINARIVRSADEIEEIVNNLR